MNKLKALLLLAGALFTLAHCTPGKSTQASVPGKDDGVIEFVILQLNDVYEISPLGDGQGGLARVAALRRELLAKNPNTFTVLAGDFISPSVIGTLKYEGKRIRGRQMVDALNTLGLDWVVFGNHEFDYDLEDLQARLDESKFAWLGANARLTTAAGTEPFFKNRDGKKETCPDRLVVPVKDADGTRINLGIFGVLIDTGRKPWVQYSDPFEAAAAQYAALDPGTDVVLALTHLSIDDDKKLAARVPAVPLIMGGHEHNNMRVPVGNAVITKADANARTVYVHTLRHDKKSGKTTVTSELRRIDQKLPDEPLTAAVVARWEKIKNDALASAGFNPTALVTTLNKPLDARETTIRFEQAPVGDVITHAMMTVSKHQPVAAVVNSGSVRVDDVLEGPLTELDVVRMLPFGGAIVEVEMRGSLLRKMLDTGVQNRGNGGYLQRWGIQGDDAKRNWTIAGAALDDKKTYRLAMPEFLLTGNEQNMSFLKAEATATGTTNPDILAIHKADPKDPKDRRNDVRHAVIQYLRK